MTSSICLVLTGAIDGDILSTAMSFTSANTSANIESYCVSSFKGFSSSSGSRVSSIRAGEDSVALTLARLTRIFFLVGRVAPCSSFQGWASSDGGRISGMGEESASKQVAAAIISRLSMSSKSYETSSK